MCGDKKKKRKLIIAILFSLLLVFASLFTLQYFGVIKISPICSVCDAVRIGSSISEGSLNYRTKEEMQEESDGKMNISMNLNPIFEDGDSEGSLNIVNESVNSYPQYVVIYIDNGYELIYKSDLIPVGSKIEDDKLSKDLDKGIYDCTAYFHQVDENGKEVGRASAKVTITVKQ